MIDYKILADPNTSVLSTYIEHTVELAMSTRLCLL